jgi:hypothetical protein
MKTAELFEQVFSDGVFLSKDGSNLKISGDEIAVRKWIEELKIHKEELVRLLSGGRLMDQKSDDLPEFCSMDCRRLDVIFFAGQSIPGCVFQLEGWQEGWRRLDKMGSCPKLIQ